MTNFQEKSKLFEERLLNFAYNIILITKQLAPSTENNVIKTQIIRSATSVGANYAEANNAVSKQDFRNKIFIAKKEAAETKYWLELLARVNGQSYKNEMAENQQILMILQKIVSTLKNGK
jgi:four helix bundle protein